MLSDLNSEVIEKLERQCKFTLCGILSPLDLAYFFNVNQYIILGSDVEFPPTPCFCFNTLETIRGK